MSTHRSGGDSRGLNDKSCGRGAEEDLKGTPLPTRLLLLYQAVAKLVYVDATGNALRRWVHKANLSLPGAHLIGGCQEVWFWQTLLNHV